MDQIPECYGGWNISLNVMYQRKESGILSTNSAGIFVVFDLEKILSHIFRHTEN